MRGEVVLELTERRAVRTFCNLAFVEVFKVVACKAVKCSGYRWSGSTVVLVRLVQFLNLEIIKKIFNERRVMPNQRKTPIYAATI